MRSIRTKITLFTVCAIIIVMIVTTVFSVAAIRNFGRDTSNQLLYLMCETGVKNLNEYFKSVEQSVEIVSEYAESDLENCDIEQLGEHLERVKAVFEKTANNTNGILTYYYRTDPSVSSDHKGFWYVNLDGEGFKEHAVTDITLYDTENQTSLVWFTVPKATGGSVWLPPYVTDSLGVYVISYNLPIYKNDRFIGVIGIEIDYNTIIEPVKNITLFDNGYAFLNDKEGKIIYHPLFDVKSLADGNQPHVPDGLLSDDIFIKYTFNGVEKQAVWMELVNGMRLNVSVPMSEINESWHLLIGETLVISAVLIIVFIIITMRLAERITKPLRDLTKAAEQLDEGNYDLRLDYKVNDEVGKLTNTFNKLTNHLKVYINELNCLAYSDALTSVHNKGAFDIYVREMQTRLNESEEKTEFAVGMFDCNDLKSVNDRFGHDKGDIYLKASSSLICRVFNHSPVFRIGGDEFAVILQNEDYQRRKELAHIFTEMSNDICASAAGQWEKVSVAIGIAEYDPEKDKAVEDVIKRADALMYEDKRIKKAKRKN